MTDEKPKTLALDSSEWCALFANNSQRLANYFNANPRPNAEELQSVASHIQRLYDLLPVWYNSFPQPVSTGNGVDKAEVLAASQEKKKRGRPAMGARQ